MNLVDKKVLLTGGSGFLGKHVYSELVKTGCRVVAPRSKHFDLRKEQDAFDAVYKYEPDVVIHLAATVGGIGANMKQPGRFFYDNIKMGIELMETARTQGVKKFVQVGTVCSYPKFCPVPFTEDNIWCGYPEDTNAPYGIAKKALLVMGQAYRQQYGFNVIHLLPVNLYGPGDNFDPETSHVIPALIKKFAEAKESGAPSVTLWGTGNASREFLYVADAAKGIVKATESYDKPEPVNLGNGEEIPIFALAAVIGNKIGYTGQILFDSSKPDGQPRRCLDTRRAMEEFGWKAETNTLIGLDKTIEWYYNQVESKD